MGSLGEVVGIILFASSNLLPPNVSVCVYGSVHDYVCVCMASVIFPEHMILVIANSFVACDRYFTTSPERLVGSLQAQLAAGLDSGFLGFRVQGLSVYFLIEGYSGLRPNSQTPKP